MAGSNSSGAIDPQQSEAKQSKAKQTTEKIIAITRDGWWWSHFSTLLRLSLSSPDSRFKEKIFLRNTLKELLLFLRRRDRHLRITHRFRI